jgi:hypothetical protein
MKSRLNSGSVWYRLVRNHISFRLLSEILKTKIFRTVIKAVICMGVKLGLSPKGNNIDLEFKSRSSDL